MAVLAEGKGCGLTFLALLPGSCSSPPWCSCHSLACTTPSSWPCLTRRSQGRSGKSRCTTRCSSTPSRCAALPEARGGGRRPAGEGGGPDPTLFSSQGFFVAIIYCFCNGEVSSRQPWGRAGGWGGVGVPPVPFPPSSALFFTCSSKSLPEDILKAERSFQMIQAWNMLGFVGSWISATAKCLPSPTGEFSVTEGHSHVWGHLIPVDSRCASCLQPSTMF